MNWIEWRVPYDLITYRHPSVWWQIFVTSAWKCLNDWNQACPQIVLVLLGPYLNYATGACHSWWEPPFMTFHRYHIISLKISIFKQKWLKKSYFEPYQKKVKFLVDKIESHSMEKLQANVTFYTVVSLAKQSFNLSKTSYTTV